MKGNKILIIDDETSVLEILDFVINDLFPSGTEVSKASGGKMAIEMIKENAYDYIISDHNMPDGTGDIVLKYLIDNSIKKKFVLCSTITPKERPNEYPSEHMFFNIEKPDIYIGVEALLNKIKEMAETKQQQEPKTEYVKVTPNFLYFLKTMPGDVYIRISETKHVRCINKGDSFDKNDLEKYTKKNSEKLYVKKDMDYKDIYKIIQKILTTLYPENPKEDNQPAILKPEPKKGFFDKMTLAHESIINTVRIAEFNEELADMTKFLIKNTVKTLSKMDGMENLLNKIPTKGEYSSRFYAVHVALLLLVAKKLKWSTDSTLTKLALASFLQDVSLTNEKIMRIYDHRHFNKVCNEFNGEETEEYLNHPLEAKKLIAHFKEIPPDVDKLLLDQSEMPDGTGFPRGLSSGQIGPMSCLFILTGVLARYMLEQEENFKMKNFVDYFGKDYYDKGNFRESFNIIRNLKEK